MTAATWPTTRLKNLVEPIQTGVWGSEPSGDQDDILCVRVADFDRQRFGLKAVETVRSVPKKDRSSRLLRSGDILLEKSGGTEVHPVGFTVMFEGDYPAVSSNFIGRVRMREGQHPRFWLYALAASYFTRRTQKCVRQTTGIQNLDQSAFFSEIFAVPPLEEQRAIADYLDRETARIDTLIEEQQRLIDMLKERRLQIVAHAIPSEGPMGRMKWDTRMVAGGTPDTSVDEYWLDGDDENGIPFVAIGDMSRRRSVTSTAKRLSESAMTSRTMPKGQPGTLLLAMYASVGEVALLEIEATWNQAILGITPDPTKLDAAFLRYALQQMRNDLLRDVRSNTQANLNATQVGDLWVPMPSLDEQRRIAAHLDDQIDKIDTTLAEAERFVELSRERRSALITAAVTGQIDVRKVA